MHIFVSALGKFARNAKRAIGTIHAFHFQRNMFAVIHFSLCKVTLFERERKKNPKSKSLNSKFSTTRLDPKVLNENRLLSLFWNLFSGVCIFLMSSSIFALFNANGGLS